MYVHFSKPHTDISGKHFYISYLSNSNIKKTSLCYLLEPRIYPLSVLWSLLFLFLGPLYLPHSHSVPIRCWSRYSASSPPTHPTNTKDFLNLGQLIYILDSISVRGLFGHLCLFVCSPSREIWTYPSGPASGKYCRVFFFIQYYINVGLCIEYATWMTEINVGTHKAAESEPSVHTQLGTPWHRARN